MLFDIMGALVSLLSTYLFIRLNNKAWLVGMLATCLNGWLYWHKGIYADMFLEIFYFISMCYGWYLWGNHYSINQGKVSSQGKQLTFKQWIVLPIVLFSIFLTIYYLLETQTNSNVAFMDAATTALSLMAQWLMCHKIILTWVLWFITDAVYAFMYLSKDLPVHCVLMLIYTGMAITGYWVWTKQRSNKDAVAVLA